MLSAFITFIASCFFTLLIVKYKFAHEKVSADDDFHGPQKFHTVAVPRVGGVAIFSALSIGGLSRYLLDKESGILVLQILISSLPVFLSGFLEDITKVISPKLRLAASFLSGLVAYWILNTVVVNLDISWLNPLFSIPLISLLITCFMVAGLTNSYNIIDGFNGLACMVGIITLSAIAYVSFRVEDGPMLFLSVIMICALLGFFIWNYPRGLIFLGDGGAYLIGFWISVLSILLTSRNPEVSPWFACLINMYPIFETIFSIWRKKFIKKISPSMPDGVHLHMLIYGRIARWINPNEMNSYFSSNARTSPFLWVLSSMAVFPAVIFWKSTWLLELFCFIFCMTYIFIYKSIVRFKVPKWVK
jgi:UDP-GlcNAc:undecaprenyl-phosphate/decaprenyl-phosphate GlcNAc-1-phosphate transferase